MVDVVSLNDYVLARCYAKLETYTKSETLNEILDAISRIQFFDVVVELPTTNIKTNRLYLKYNSIASDENLFDIYLYVNNRWEKLDSFDFNFDDYYRKNDVDNLLAGKSDITHIHSNASTISDGFLSSSDKFKLDGIEDGADKTVVDNSLSDSSGNAVANRVIKSALDGKAVKNHQSETNDYGVSTNSLYGHSKASSTTPLMDGVASTGSEVSSFARGDHVHPTDTSRASTSVATTLSNGLMSANDKAKLDSIEAEANKTVLADSITESTIYAVPGSVIKEYVDEAIEEGGSIDLSGYLKKTGGAMTGALSSNSEISTTDTIEASIIKKTNGTSSQFLKADGSIDSNIYLTEDTSSDIITTGTIEADAIKKTGGTSNQFLKADGTVDINTYLKTSGGTLTGDVSSNSKITTTDTIEANTIKKQNGTSSQFLKADGSTDSNTYLTSVPSHTSTNGSNVGQATDSVYGHAKVINNLTTSSHTNGNALSAYQGKVLKDSVDSKSSVSYTQTSSASADGAFEVGRITIDGNQTIIYSKDTTKSMTYSNGVLNFN